MTTIAEATLALTTELEGAGLRVAAGADGLTPPAVIVYGDGVRDLRSIGRGEVVRGWRLTIIGGAWDGKGAAAELGAMLGTVLGTLRQLPGWRVDDVGRDTIVSVAGGDSLACDVLTSRSCTV